MGLCVSGGPGWGGKRRGEVYALSDPSEPQFVRDFGLPGQEPGSTGPQPSDMHGAISTGPKGNRIYAGYGTTKSGVIEILDRDKLIHGPKEPTAANLESPMIARLDLPPDVGAHTTFPMIGVDVPNLGKYGPAISKRNFLLIEDETTLNERPTVAQLLLIFHIT